MQSGEWYERMGDVPDHFLIANCLRLTWSLVVGYETLEFNYTCKNCIDSNQGFLTLSHCQRYPASKNSNIDSENIELIKSMTKQYFI
jgi:hypothetical protein